MLFNVPTHPSFKIPTRSNDSAPCPSYLTPVLAKPRRLETSNGSL